MRQLMTILSGVLVVAVLASPVVAGGVPLDISGEFNMDAWCGPKEFQVCLGYADLYEPDMHLAELQGREPQGVGLWIVAQDEYLICNTTASPGFDEPYSIATTAGHPVWKDGTQGTPEDGVVIGADRTYHMASVLGNATLPGDWTEVANPTAGDGGYASGEGMDVHFNAMCTYASYSGLFQIREAVAELPAGQKGRYNNINFLLAAMNTAERARYMQIYALYGPDGSDEQLLYEFAEEMADGPVILDNDGGQDFRIAYAFDETYTTDSAPDSDAGYVHELQGSLYEFAEPLALDSDKALWGIKIVDRRPSVNYQARGLTIFAATAYSWSEAGPFDADPEKCSVEADPILILSDESQPSTITIDLVDRNYQKITGKAADISVSVNGTGASTVSAVAEVAGGVYEVSLTNDTDGAKIIEIEVSTAGGPVTLADHPVVTVYTPGVSGPPLADAGPDRTVTDSDEDGVENVVLDGSDSTDPDGTIVNYLWTTGTQQIATGPAPEVSLSVGAHLITLQIVDNEGWTDSDQVWVTVRANGYNPGTVELDISGGFNMDSWIGPKEYQALLWYYPSGRDLKEVQGDLTDGVGWYVIGQNYMMIGNVSPEGLGEPYSIYTMWFHPLWKDGTLGTPEDGYLSGADRDYFIASTRGNPVLRGDWLEVDEPVVPNPPHLMANQPNTILVGPANSSGSWWLEEVMVELPADQQGRYEDINFVVVGGVGYYGIQLAALYRDGSEEILWTHDGLTPDLNELWAAEELYDSTSGSTGGIRAGAGTPYYLSEFAAPFPLNANKVLTGIVVRDTTLPSGGSNVGLAIVAATATLPPSPELEVGPAQFDTVNNLMYFDLVFLNSDGRTDMIGGFGASASLGGADAGHFTAAPDEVRNKLGTEMEALVDPAPYAWTTFLFPVVANSTSPEQMAFGQNAWFPTEHVALDSLVEGTVVARFYYEWDGVEVSEVCVTIESYAQVDPGPVFTTSAGGLVLGTVINDGQNILVPAAGDPAISIAVQDDLDWVYQNTANSMSNGGHMISLAVSVTDLNGNNDVSVTVEKVSGSGAGEATFLDDPGGDPLVKYISGGMRSDGLAGTGTLTLRVTATGDVAGQATVDLPFTVRPLGDVDGNGAPEPGDVTVLILDLNGTPPPGYNARAFDLDANGAAEPGDVQILINVLNALPVP